MSVPHPLPEPLIEIIARRFRVLGEPTRIRLLDRLRAGDATVADLVAALGTTQQNVAKHLAVLQDAGIVARDRDGQAWTYTIADPTVLELCEIVCGGVARSIDELAALLGDRS